MKSIYVVFEDEEFKALKKAKKKLSWHDFVMLAVKHNPELRTDRDIEPELELEVDSDFLNHNEIVEMIREIDSTFDPGIMSGTELNRYYNELKQK